MCCIFILLIIKWNIYPFLVKMTEIYSVHLHFGSFWPLVCPQSGSRAIVKGTMSFK